MTTTYEAALTAARERFRHHHREDGGLMCSLARQSGFVRPEHSGFCYGRDECNDPLHLSPGTARLGAVTLFIDEDGRAWPQPAPEVVP